MGNTRRKAQQLQKKGNTILDGFMQMEETLSAHVEESQKLQAEIKAEVDEKFSLLDQLAAAEEESQTVLQNLKAFLGRS
ncbi:hypothetical protein [Enterococcus entomosocium]|uniref:hypothetical protein n=1 Tax=Enterococcus entomosocium TaxID=3034352 RepID=UPI002649D2FF|nr:hypothetical protein [Enterococcus entomosocium]